MISALLSIAFAQDAKVFETDQAAAEWILLTRSTMRAPLPVIGPPELSELRPLLANADVRLFALEPDMDPDEAAVRARSKVGAPCTLSLAPLGDGWTGWVDGHCGLLFLGAWRYEQGRVIDDRGRPISVPQFASDAGDTRVLATYKRLDRIRGRAIWNTILGTGLIYVGQVGRAAAQNDDAETTGWWITTGVGAALTGAGVGQFVWVQADKRSHPRRLSAHYSEDEIQERIEAHNARLRLVSISPFGVGGTF